MRAAAWTYGRLRSGGSHRPGLRILMYHAVGTPIEGDVRGLYTMTTSRFATHVRHLIEGYSGRLVPLEQAALTRVESLRVAVTFDDGYRDNLSVAAPLLVEACVPFTVFVTTGPVAARKSGFLNPDDLRELAGLPGVSIGSHSVTHPRLSECNDRQLSEELGGSKEYLEDLLGIEVASLSYPHGAVTRRVLDAARMAGYRIAASSRFDINHYTRDQMMLCRTDIWAQDDRFILEQKLRGDWDWIRWRALDPSADGTHLP